MVQTKFKTGLILSGGGARGFAHLGAIQALYENKIYPDVISGVSAGAIVGALIADGQSPDKILENFSKKTLLKFLEFSYPKYGIMRFTGLARVLKSQLKAQTFEDLKIPLYIAATNLNAGKIQYFSQGELADKILASSTIPGLVRPLKIEGDLYVDGGVLDNFPIKPIWRQCERLIGIHINPKREGHSFPNVISIVEHTFNLAVSRNIWYKSKKCQLFIEPPLLSEFHITDIKKGKKIFETGYKYTKELLKSHQSQ